MAVDITTRPTFSAGPPRVLFEGRYFQSPTGRPSYDVSLDGQRFLMTHTIEPEPPRNQIHVVTNWFEELKRRVPVK
jgi:hypothetical protein